MGFIKMVQSNKGQLKIQVHKNRERFLVPRFSKKSQLKIQEMSFMLVAVVLFFILVGLFALSIVMKNLQESATNLAEERAYTTSLGWAESAEFTCGDKPNCIDTDKLIALVGKRNLYKKFWSEFSSVRVVTNRGVLSNESFVECNSGNLGDCDEFVIFDRNVQESSSYSSNYVSLCRIIYASNGIPYEKCEIGRIEIGVERK